MCKRDCILYLGLYFSAGAVVYYRDVSEGEREMARESERDRGNVSSVKIDRRV